MLSRRSHLLALAVAQLGDYCNCNKSIWKNLYYKLYETSTLVMKDESDDFVFIQF